MYASHGLFKTCSRTSVTTTTAGRALVRSRQFEMNSSRHTRRHLNASLMNHVAVRFKSAVPNTSAAMQHDMIVPKADWALHSYAIQPRESLNDKMTKAEEMVANGSLNLLLDMQGTKDQMEAAALADAAQAALLENQKLQELEAQQKRQMDLYQAKNYMSEEEISKWLEGFEIPAEQLAQCQTEEEVNKLRLLYARQIRLECSVYDLAMERRQSSMTNVRDLGRSSHTNAAKSLLIEWMEPAQNLIREEQLNILSGKSGIDRGIYGPALLMLKPEVYAAVTINVMLNQCLMDANGSKFIKVALAVGKAIQEEIIHNKQTKTDYYMRLARNVKNTFMRTRLKDMYDEVGLWDKRINLKIGAALIDLIQRSCHVPQRALKRGQDTNNTPTSKEEPTLAFLHGYIFERNRRSGVIRCHDQIMSLILSENPSANCLSWTARYLPMLVPPKKWNFVTNGGYLKLHTKIMRQRDSAWQMDCVKRGALDPMYNALNALAEVPWVVNREVLDVILALWHQGGGFGDLPQRHDIEVPEMEEDYAQDPEKLALYEKMVKKIRQKNQELHSLRCDTLYKLQVAEEFKEEEAIYFPYNMDFRGRVYPIPPNLNHLGSDLSRSLLIFKDKKPLGKNGLRWLKIHLANVFGVDKCSFDERVEFAEANLDKVFASASNPLGGKTKDDICNWWKKADYPFLALGVCFELNRALQSSNPEEYLSNIPVHQDGSCNGLQHYAALGRDASGGAQVNLVPSPRPSDVYTGVAEQVMRKVERDAHLEIPTTGDEQVIKAMQRRKTYANFLLGTITRKVVKQTVMTSVYGVTYIGARKQIQARLEETFLTKGHLMDNELEDKIYHAACYAAETTMESMGDLFTSARSIMEWLSDCASKVAAEGQPMSWITPMGLPVVQPYRKGGSQQIRTKVQHVLLTVTEKRPVSGGRQKTAFPPNFVHSLDSTHMLMTAVKCLQEDKIAFAAVHDSYWTHACSVDTMNQRLRQEFVHLYEQPLLDTLLQQLRLRFPSTEFHDVPKLGQLKLKDVLESPYFFN